MFCKEKRFDVPFNHPGLLQYPHRCCPRVTRYAKVTDDPSGTEASSITVNLKDKFQTELLKAIFHLPVV
jgi:hypothetical protein